MLNDSLPTYPSQLWAARWCLKSRHRAKDILALLFNLPHVLLEVVSLNVLTETRWFPNILRWKHTTLSSKIGLIYHPENFPYERGQSGCKKCLPTEYTTVSKIQVCSLSCFYLGLPNQPFCRAWRRTFINMSVARQTDSRRWQTARRSNILSANSFAGAELFLCKHFLKHKATFAQPRRNEIEWCHRQNIETLPDTPQADSVEDALLELLRTPLSNFVVLLLSKVYVWWDILNVTHATCRHTETQLSRVSPFPHIHREKKTSIMWTFLDGHVSQGKPNRPITFRLYLSVISNGIDLKVIHVHDWARQPGFFSASTQERVKEMSTRGIRGDYM